MAHESVLFSWILNPSCFPVYRLAAQKRSRCAREKHQRSKCDTWFWFAYPCNWIPLWHERCRCPVVALSFIPVTIGLLLHLYPNRMKTIVFPLLFLFFAVPIPIERAGFVLQTISASASASLLCSLGMNVSRHGVQLGLENSSFFVGEPCSGMQTLVSLLALAALLAYFMHCCLVKKLSLFFSAIPLAIIANTFRLCTIVFAACLSGNTNTALRFHALSSILMFGFALVLFISIAKLLKCEVMLR